MDKNKNALEDQPPFFREWKGLYWFVLLFEVALILTFIFITEYYTP